MGDNEMNVPGSELAVGLVATVFVVIGVVFVAIVIILVIGTVRRYRAAKSAGLDPFAPDIQVMGAVAHAAALAPERPTADRLAEVDRLYQQQQISEAERDAARARILGAL